MFSKIALWIVGILAILLVATLAVEEIRIYLLNEDLTSQKSTNILLNKDNVILTGNVSALTSALQVQNDKFIALQTEMAVDKKARDADVLLAVQNRKSKITIGGDDAASMNAFMKELFE